MNMNSYNICYQAQMMNIPLASISYIFTETKVCRTLTGSTVIYPYTITTMGIPA